MLKHRPLFPPWQRRKKRQTTIIPKSERAPSHTRMLLEPMKRAVARDETEHISQRSSRGHQIPTLPTSSDAVEEDKCHRLPLSTCPTARQQTELRLPTRRSPVREPIVNHQTQISPDLEIGKMTRPRVLGCHRMEQRRAEKIYSDAAASPQ
jgi:hypothetical protein